MTNSPLNYEVAAAIGAFFFGGAGPSHSTLTRAFRSCDLDHVAPQDPDRNKEQRVHQTLIAAESNPETAKRLTGHLLYELKRHGDLDGPESRHLVADLKRSLEKLGWDLSAAGELVPGYSAVVATARDRPALNDQLARLRRANDDAALLLGTAKEMLESTAKYVLEEFGYADVDRMDFASLWFNARDRLRIHPKDFGGDTPGAKHVRIILQSAWTIAEQANALRNEEGTGHGYTLPTGVTDQMARLVVREACSLTEFVLGTLDARGRP